jgi:hypothetical protein
MPSCCIGSEHLTWDAEADGFCVNKDHEVDICCHLASEADILEPDDIVGMKEWFTLGQSETAGFQGQPKA